LPVDHRPLFVGEWLLMLITSWLNMLRDGPAFPPVAETNSGVGRATVMQSYFGAQEPAWFGRRLQPATVSAIAQRSRRLRAHQRLG